VAEEEGGGGGGGRREDHPAPPNLNVPQQPRSTSPRCEDDGRVTLHFRGEIECTRTTSLIN